MFDCLIATDFNTKIFRILFSRYLQYVVKRISVAPPLHNAYWDVKTEIHRSGGRAIEGMCLRPLACWDCGFESRQGAWMSVTCECCVWSGRGPCVGPFTRPEQSYRTWCVWV
jgi:predicted Zn-ribbon and HTH transcriptional regulator